MNPYRGTQPIDDVDDADLALMRNLRPRIPFVVMVLICSMMFAPFTLLFVLCFMVAWGFGFHPIAFPVAYVAVLPLGAWVAKGMRDKIDGRW